MVKINSEKITALDLIKKINLEVEQGMPAKDIMMQDLKMMNFKVRPVSGDLFALAKRDIGFLKSLWKLGKIDEIVSDRMHLLEDDEKDMFLHYMEDMQKRTQVDISGEIEKLNKREQKKLNILEFEIFKDKFVDKTKLN